MSDYKAKNYIDNGILDFILDICSPKQWHPEKLEKENIPLLTPVENVYPPMINPPYSFEDIISGSKDKPKTIYFPSNSDGTPKRWDGEQDTRFKAIDDFNAYAKHYDERVEDIYGMIYIQPRINTMRIVSIIYHLMILLMDLGIN